MTNATPTQPPAIDGTLGPGAEIRGLPPLHKVLTILSVVFLAHKILVGPLTVIYILVRFGWGYGLAS